MLMRLCGVLVILTGITLATLPTSYDRDVKKYSYICIQDNQDLCLGISPGEGEPFYDPNAPPFLLQVKKRLNNEDQGTDYKKTRWDVRFQENMISLSRFPDLCISLKKPAATPNELALYPCSDVQNNTRKGKWDMKFNTNINEESTIELLGDDDCITVMLCKIGDLGFCDPLSETVATDGKYVSGAYVKTKPCWWAKDGKKEWKSAQTFVQALDCAVGCSPMLQNNNVCDVECANSQCNLDNERCLTAAPTPATYQPSSSPTFTPTKEPTTMAPSFSPTTSKPTASPTLHPTSPPTSTKSPVSQPTKQPISASPTNKPTTRSPSISPTNLPTSEAPSAAPSQSPAAVTDLQKDPPTAAPTGETQPLNAAIAVAVAVPVLLLLLLCLVCLLVVRERRRKRLQRNPKSWSSLIDVNQAAFIEHHKNKRQPFCTRVKQVFTGKKPASPPSNVTSLSSHLPVDHIIVTSSEDDWHRGTSGNARNGRRPKLVGA